MDKQREKLIELIVNADTHDSYECKLCTKDDVACECCGAEKLADHLLADEEIKHAFELLKAEKEGRLIVPPCKVGDKVYFVVEDEFNEMYISVECITEVGSRGFWTSASILPCDDMDNFEPWGTIGKTAFLSCEDAEKALAERKEK